jgi:glucosyl-3-phosphoglycerate synthase
VTDRMNGRVTRLFMTPLLRSLQVVVGRHPLLVYLDSFRYALAGEFAMKSDLARVNRIPSDWGLEIGMLAEIYRNCALKRICQTELCANYDHKHQVVSADDHSKGLVRMCTDIAQNLIRTLASEGIVFTEGLFQTLLVQYIRMAQDTITRYHADASINGLGFDRHDEEGMVAVFAGALRTAYERFLADPLGAPLIPNWNRIASAIPDFLDQLRAAVDEDCIEGAAS